MIATAKGGMVMAAIDTSQFPESTRQSLLAATYKMAQTMFQDPGVREEYELWLAERKKKEGVNKK